MRESRALDIVLVLRQNTPGGQTSAGHSLLEPGVGSVVSYTNQVYRGPDILCEIQTLRQHPQAQTYLSSLQERAEHMLKHLRAKFFDIQKKRKIQSLTDASAAQLEEIKPEGGWDAFCAEMTDGFNTVLFRRMLRRSNQPCTFLLEMILKGTIHMESLRLCPIHLQR